MKELRDLTEHHGREEVLRLGDPRASSSSLLLSSLELSDAQVYEPELRALVPRAPRLGG